MPKSSCNQVPPAQQILLKVAKCLFNQYINNFHLTKDYLANPNSGLNDALSEIIAVNTLVSNSSALAGLDKISEEAQKALVPVTTPPTPPAPIFSSTALFYATYADGVNIDSAGTIQNANNKVIEILNTDECVTTASQVRPESIPAGGYQTVATVGGRSGCAGESNTGFILLRVEVDIVGFPFNTCIVKNPCDV
jgi:hypothetical protein